MKLMISLISYLMIALSIDHVYSPWKSLNYRCVTFSKKYMVAYLSTAKEIIICEFVSSKILKD